MSKGEAPRGHAFEVKDSGKRVAFASGMLRDTDEGKPRFDLLDREFLKRWALHMAKGAEKYGEENWRKAEGEAELRRFRASAFRHLIQWLNDERDEDHAAAVAFNVSAAEMVRGRLELAMHHAQLEAQRELEFGGTPRDQR